MAETHRIAFPADDVRAFIDGRKRRISVPVEGADGFTWYDNGTPILWPARRTGDGPDDWEWVDAPWRTGDRIVVLEEWCQKSDEDGMPVYNADGNRDSSCCWYKADGIQVAAIDDDGGLKFRKDGKEASPWLSPVTMPSWASRLTLTVEEVGVQRLGDVTRSDVRDEGVPDTWGDWMTLPEGIEDGHVWDNMTFTEQFAFLWSTRHPKHPWSPDRCVFVAKVRRDDG